MADFTARCVQGFCILLPDTTLLDKFRKSVPNDRPQQKRLSWTHLIGGGHCLHGCMGHVLEIHEATQVPQCMAESTFERLLGIASLQPCLQGLQGGGGKWPHSAYWIGPVGLDRVALILVAVRAQQRQDVVVCIREDDIALQPIERWCETRMLPLLHLHSMGVWIHSFEAYQ